MHPCWSGLALSNLRKWGNGGFSLLYCLYHCAVHVNWLCCASTRNREVVTAVYLTLSWYSFEEYFKTLSFVKLTHRVHECVCVCVCVCVWVWGDCECVVIGCVACEQGRVWVDSIKQPDVDWMCRHVLWYWSTLLLYYTCIPLAKCQTWYSRSSLNLQSFCEINFMKFWTVLNSKYVCVCVCVCACARERMGTHVGACVCTCAWVVYTEDDGRRGISWITHSSTFHCWWCVPCLCVICLPQ